MTAKHEKAIQETRDYLLSSGDVEEDRKDVLRILLDKADVAANGCKPEQKLQLLVETVHMFILDHVRESIRGPERFGKLMRAMVQCHAEDCQKMDHIEQMERMRIEQQSRDDKQTARDDALPKTFREAMILSLVKCPYATAAVLIVYILSKHLG